MDRRALVVVVVVFVGLFMLTRKLSAAALSTVVLPTTPEALEIKAAAERVFSRRGITVVITSGMDGSHSRQSLHDDGFALDLRRWDADARAVTDIIVAELRTELGPDYDVILEPDHIHVEYDPE